MTKDIYPKHEIFHFGVLPQSFISIVPKHPLHWGIPGYIHLWVGTSSCHNFC